MVGLIIATSIIGTAFVVTTVLGSIKMYRMSKNMDTIAQCLLTYMTHPEDIDVMEGYPVKQSNWTFPNSEGF